MTICILLCEEHYRKYTNHFKLLIISCLCIIITLASVFLKLIRCLHFKALYLITNGNKSRQDILYSMRKEPLFKVKQGTRFNSFKYNTRSFCLDFIATSELSPIEILVWESDQWPIMVQMVNSTALLIPTSWSKLYYPSKQS